MAWTIDAPETGLAVYLGKQEGRRLTRDRSTLFVRVCVATAAVWMIVAPPAFAQPGFLSGFVVDEVGEPVSGATVSVTGHAGGSVYQTATTGEDGRFLLLVRQSDNWEVTVEASGFAPASGSTRVRFGVKQSSILIRLARRETPELWGVLAGAKPGLISAQLTAADALLDGGHYDEAIEAYQRIRNQTPALSAVGLQIGRAYLQKGDFKKAETELDAVLASGSAEAAACCALGDLKSAQGLPDEAAAWYQKSAEADPSWTKPLMKLADLAHAQGNLQAAVGHLRRVVAVDPGCQDAARAAALLKSWGE
jgi:hypothetical protein